MVVDLIIINSFDCFWGCFYAFLSLFRYTHEHENKQKKLIKYSLRLCPDDSAMVDHCGIFETEDSKIRCLGRANESDIFLSTERKMKWKTLFLVAEKVSVFR